MSGTMGFGESVLPMAMQIGNVLIIIIVSFLLIGIMAALVWFVVKNRAYTREVIIIRQKSNGRSIEFDKGGYFRNKNKDWKFRLKKNKTWLEGKYADEIALERGGNAIFLFRDTADNFYHISPEIMFSKGLVDFEIVKDETGNPVQVLDSKGLPVFNADGKPKYLKRLKLKLSVTAEDVEWAKASFNEYSTTYSHKNWLSQILPVAAGAIFTLLVIIVFYMLLQKFDVLQAVAASLADTAKNLLALKQSGIPSNAPI